MLTIVENGYGYVDNEVVTIDGATLAGLGAIATATDGFLSFGIPTVSDQTNVGQILAVAQTSSEVALTGGNEAVFYWNLKQFGFHSVAA